VAANQPTRCGRGGRRTANRRDERIDASTRVPADRVVESRRKSVFATPLDLVAEPFSVVCRTAPLPLVVEVLGAHDVFSRVDAFRLNFGWIGARTRIKIGGDVILDTAHIVDRNDADRAAPKAGLLR
jgi:hypothetical protein